jgi:excisionase family DNA binding protein
MEVTISEAARRLRISERTIRRRLHTGELQGSQVSTAGGFAWMVEVPEDLPGDSPDSGEKVPTATLIARMAAQIEAQQEQLAVKDRQLESKDRQIEQLHVLLQQAQAALPAPKDNQHSWWYKLWHRNGR